MINGRFSLDSFLGCSSIEERRTLADELQDAVLQELHEVVEQRWQQVVAALNALGHKLRSYGEQTQGDLHVRDDVVEETGEYDCKLRLACDLTISAGFADVQYSKSRPGQG